MEVEPVEVDARGMRFDGLAAGPAAGELVLLLHGFPQSAEIWRPALAMLSDAGFRAVAINQRGYSLGARPDGAAAYALNEVTDDAVALIAALGHSRAHVIGHDWGATVAWAMGSAHARWLATLIAISTPHTAALRDALRGWPQRSRMLYIPLLRLPLLAETAASVLDGRAMVELLVRSGLSRDHARRDVARLREVGATGPLNWYRAIGAGTFRGAGPVAVPTLYIWSDRDVAFSREAAEATERWVTGPHHFLELQGASHWIPDEHWDDVADLVVAHLSGAA